MHPYLLEAFAHDRVAAMHHSAGARAGQHPRLRIGRMLVTVGQRLIGDGTTGGRSTPLGR